MLSRVSQLLLIACISFVGLIFCAPVYAAEVDLTSISDISVVQTGEQVKDRSDLSPTPDPSKPDTATSSVNHKALTSSGEASGFVTGSIGEILAKSSSSYSTLFGSDTSYATNRSFGTIYDSGPASSTSVKITMVLHGSYPAPYPYGLGSYDGYAIGYITILDERTLKSAKAQYSTIGKSGGPFSAKVSDTLTGTLKGDKLDVTYNLDVGTYVNGIASQQSYSSSVVDLSNTAQFFIDQPGGTPFIGETGYDYSSPVPIPGTLLLVGPVLMGLAAARRRFNR